MSHEDKYNEELEEVDSSTIDWRPIEQSLYPEQIEAC